MDKIKYKKYKKNVRNTFLRIKNLKLLIELTQDLWGDIEELKQKLHILENLKDKGAFYENQ